MPEISAVAQEPIEQLVADVDRPALTLEQFHRLLQAGVQHGASDIHFRVGDAPTYRVHGKLVQMKLPPLRMSDTKVLCEYAITEPGVRAELATLQEHDTSYSLPGVSRLRVNVFRQRG
jgi:twitching motility protein PilT